MLRAKKMKIITEYNYNKLNIRFTNMIMYTGKREISMWQCKYKYSTIYKIVPLWVYIYIYLHKNIIVYKIKIILMNVNSNVIE